MGIVKVIKYDSINNLQKTIQLIFLNEKVSVYDYTSAFKRKSFSSFLYISNLTFRINIIQQECTVLFCGKLTLFLTNITYRT